MAYPASGNYPGPTDFPEFENEQVRVVREKAPLRLSVDVTTPLGHHQRWAQDEPNIQNVPTNLMFSTTVPGGYENCSLSLPRKPGRQYSDLDELTKLSVRGVGGDIAWQGRIESSPRTSGYEWSISPNAVGYQSSLEDNQSARMIYLDCNLSNWTGPSLQRQINVLGLGVDFEEASVVSAGSSLTTGDVAAGSNIVTNIPSTAGMLGSNVQLIAGDGIPNLATITSVDSATQIHMSANATLSKAGGALLVTTSVPSLVTSVTGAWSRFHQSESWYDAQGLPIAKLYYAWRNPSSLYVSGPDTNWHWNAYLCNDDVATAGGVDATSPELRGAGPGSASLSATTSTRRWAQLIFSYNTGPAGGEGIVYPLCWTGLGVVGNHGLTMRGSWGNAPGGLGLYASDVVGHAVSTWAPNLATSNAAGSTITGSTFIVPQLSFTQATTSSNIIKEVTKYELQDWFIWESASTAYDGTFWWGPRNSMGKKWRARAAATGLSDTGPQVSRIWNGCVVQFSDVGGVSRTVGPPGSGANSETSLLLDSDPLNPANEANIKRWTLLSMGTSTPGAAVQIGQQFLQQSKLLDHSGQANVVGHCEDENGVLWPAWKIRGGDQIAFVDSADPGYRRVVRTEYSDATKTNSLSLDSPPEGLQALLERLAVVISPIGF